MSTKKAPFKRLKPSIALAPLWVRQPRLGLGSHVALFVCPELDREAHERMNRAHRHVLGEKLVAAPDGVKHLAVCRHALPPWISWKAFGEGSNQRKCKQRDQNPSSLLRQEGISRLRAKS